MSRRRLHKIQGADGREFSQFVLAQFDDAIPQVVDAGKRTDGALADDRATRLLAESPDVSETKTYSQTRSLGDGETGRNRRTGNRANSPCYPISRSLFLPVSPSPGVRLFLIGFLLYRAQPVRARDIDGQNLQPVALRVF